MDEEFFNWSLALHVNSEFPGIAQCTSAASQMLRSEQIHPPALEKKQFASESLQYSWK